MKGKLASIFSRREQIDLGVVVCQIGDLAGDDRRQRVHLIPVDEHGMVNGIDGRRWKFNGEKLLANAAKYPVKYPGDYFHASLTAPETGADAPACGWIDPASLTVEKNGLWGEVEWTERAAGAIREKEYRYLSPVFLADRKTGETVAFKGFGLTHYPNLGDLSPVANSQLEDNAMEELLERIKYLLNLPELATPEDILAELEKAVSRIRAAIGNTEANRLRAFAYVDLAAVSPSAAITARGAHGAKRTMLLWPKLQAWSTAANATVDVPASAFALGLRAKLDNDVGWHKSLSNDVVTGAIGISQPVDWALQDPNSTANLLNANEITTMIRQGGFRFWGNRTPATDPVWAFEVSVRTGDVLADSIAEAHLWAMDKPMSKQLFEEIVEGVNAKFRELKAQGYIVDGKAWLDQDLNTKTSLAAGKLWIDYDYTPVPPLENLNFNATITDRYLLELVGGK